LGSHTSIQLDAKGELTNAEQGDGNDQIAEALVDGKVLRLTIGDKGHALTGDGEDDDQVKFEMKLTGKEQAEIRLLGAPQGQPTPKPWKLQRTKAGQ
jgi:hypothetical protein